MQTITPWYIIYILCMIVCGHIMYLHNLLYEHFIVYVTDNCGFIQQFMPLQIMNINCDHICIKL